MKNKIGLIILVLGLLIGGLSSFAAFSFSAKAFQSEVPNPDQSVLRAPVETLAVPSFNDTSPSWEPPVPQDPTDPRWLYGIFTPPKIFIDSNGRFTAEPPKAPEPPIPFGIRLVDVAQTLYRFQFDGYVEEDPTDKTKVLALLFDRTKVGTNEPTTVGIREGQVRPELGIEVREVDVARFIDEETNLILYRESVTLFDTELNAEIVLEYGRPYVLGESTLTFESTLSMERTQLKSSVTQFAFGGFEYIIEEIDASAGAVRITKVVPDKENETRTLVRSASTPSTRGPSGPAGGGTSSPAQPSVPSGLFQGFDF